MYNSDLGGIHKRCGCMSA